MKNLDSIKRMKFKSKREINDVLIKNSYTLGGKRWLKSQNGKSVAFGKVKAELIREFESKHQQVKYYFITYDLAGVKQNFVFVKQSDFKNAINWLIEHNIEFHSRRFKKEEEMYRDLRKLNIKRLDLKWI